MYLELSIADVIIFETWLLSARSFIKLKGRVFLLALHIARLRLEDDQLPSLDDLGDYLHRASWL